MKYHGHEIKVVIQDLGYSGDESWMNKTYEIYKDNEYINVAWSLNNAKEFIDSDYDIRYLC
jgi:hypothetical protein